MEKVALFAHGGSRNHGCEAIVRGLVKLYGLSPSDILLSNRKEEDLLYGVDHLISVEQACRRITPSFGYKIRSVLSGNTDRFFYQQKYSILTNLVSGCDKAFSIGGDNYCYPGMPLEMSVMRQLIAKERVPTFLVGCSIDPSMLDRFSLNDLKRFDGICCRESLSYHALKTCGIKRLTLTPDPAFFLDARPSSLPQAFQRANMVGINISPLLLKSSQSAALVLSNYQRLIDYILKETTLGVALIPHVVWNHNDDRAPLSLLWNHFSETGRVVLIEDHCAEELKGIISQCRFMVAARTHASIAAYSSKVPTLVVGYSVKARGIAKDLLETERHYVLPIQEMKRENDLLEEFKWIMDNEDKVRNLLDNRLPEYLKEFRA